MKEVEIQGVRVASQIEDAAFGIVVGRGCRVEPADLRLNQALDEAIAETQVRAGIGEITSSVRGVLRRGKYKPTGRGKPASEYLVQAARENRFPRISNLVDINNLISLQALLPISLVDIERAGSSQFVVRSGRKGESYVFNASGQAIDLEDLILIAYLPEDMPCANPVKDSMPTKLRETSTEVMAVLYAPASMEGELRTATLRFEVLLASCGKARATEHTVLRGA